MLCIEIAGVVDMVDVEHDQPRGDGVGRLARAIATESASVGRDDRQLTFETRKLVGVFAVEKFNLVADVLHGGLAHCQFDL